MRELSDVPRAAPAWAVSLFVTSLALWFGAAMFLSAGVMPVLFTRLEPSEAGRIASLIFPIYFRGGLAVGVVACIASLVVARSGGRLWLASTLLLVLMTAAQAWTTLVVAPEMGRIRGDVTRVERFQELHRLSVRLNAVILIGGLVLVAGSGFLLSKRGRA
jgi:hypothetical protein